MPDRGWMEFVLGSVECDEKLHEHGTHSERSGFPEGGSFENPNLYYDVYVTSEDGKDNFLIPTSRREIQPYLETLRQLIGKRVRAKIKWRPNPGEGPIELKSDIKGAPAPTQTETQSTANSVPATASAPSPANLDSGLFPNFSTYDPTERDIRGLRPDGRRKR